MKLKHAILEQFDLRRLKKACKDLELTDVDRRSTEDMTETLSRARRATPAVLFEYLKETEVKAVARLVRKRPRGRKNAMIEQLLEAEESGQLGRKKRKKRKKKRSKKKRRSASPQSTSTTVRRKIRRRSSAVPQDTQQYQHQDEAVQRPDVGVQDQFQAKKPPKTYRYDSSLDPALSWDEQRERDLGEWLLGLIETAASEGEHAAFPQPQEWQGGGVVVASTIEAIELLKSISQPFLNWAGKAERHEIEVPTLPLFVHERHSTKAILDGIRHRKAKGLSLDLFGDPELDIRDRLEAYEHKGPWQNRMILGDSLQVMNSLLEFEGLGGQVQMIYIDPPYGVKFGSNFQPFVRKRDVKHGGDGDMTREPEMVKAYRDTWELGLHSYLGYLRDRLAISRDLLADTGSLFLQISDDHVHHVRSVIEEVFGEENFVSLITFSKTSGFATKTIATIGDHILWFAKNIEKLHVNRLFERQDLTLGEGNAKWVLLPDGSFRGVTAAEKRGEEPVPDGAKLYAPGDIQSQGASSEPQPFEYKGKTYEPLANSHWKANYPEGMQRLAEVGRIHVARNSIRYRRFAEDFPYQQLGNIWTDTRTGNFTDEKLYVVQTNSKVVERCLMLATGPGDLVLDPTCGSGTTAYAAERWGRRWITIDTSRVPLALARQRLLTATFPYFELKNPSGGPAAGFQYAQKQNRNGEEIGGLVPHVTLKSIANNDPPVVETLVDKPEVLDNVTRVTGPFALEAVIAPVQPIEEGADERSPTDAANHVERMTEVLRQSKTLQLPGNRKLTLAGIRRTVDAEYLHAEATEGEHRIAIVFGPEDGAISSRAVYEAARDAHFLKFDRLYFFGFAIQAKAREMVEDVQQLRIPATYVAVTPDVTMTDLLKTNRASEIFSVTGLPDIEIRKSNRKSGDDALYQVELLGLDIFDPETLESESIEGQNVPCWMLDTDYDGMCFYATQVFFPKTSAWDNLQRSLGATFEDSVWEHLAGTISEPFALGEHRCVAVKVIDERGNELLRVRDVEG